MIQIVYKSRDYHEQVVPIDNGNVVGIEVGRHLRCNESGQASR